MAAKKTIALLTFILFSILAGAQSRPIGYWTSHFAYNNGYGVATDGVTLFAISSQSFFSLRTKDPEMLSYSKVNGMSDVGMQAVAYDEVTKTVVLVYANGNIDLFRDNTFFNIPDLKLKTVVGDKKVYQVYTHMGKAYLSTSLGVIVLDLAEKTIDESYQFIVGGQFVAVSGFVADDTYFYAATPGGLYRAPKNSPQLQNFPIWKRLDSTKTLSSAIAANGSMVFADRNTVYVLTSDTLKPVFVSGKEVATISAGDGRMFVAEYGAFSTTLSVLDNGFNVVDSYKYTAKVHQVVELDDKSIWLADEFTGLGKIEANRKLGLYMPDGPGDQGCFDISAYNGRVYVAHGAYADNFISRGNLNGFSELKDGRWSNRRRDIYYTYTPFGDTMSDFVTIVHDRQNDITYAGSFTYGLFELRGDGTYKVYSGGSVFGRSLSSPSNYPIVGVGLDRDNNLWVTQFGAYYELYVRPNGSTDWRKFHLNYPRQYPYPGGPMAFDQANNVWYASLFGNGLIGYSTNNTLDDSTDDYSYRLINGVGSGNLPDAAVRCLAIDKNDNLWVGTSNGIGIVYNASNALRRKSDAEIPIVQYDDYAGYLFAGEVVRTIAVDGANRKWVGTNNGIWLLSPDAGNSKIVARFTEDNSPLPSNRVQKITVDPVTGDVYIGTEMGLVVYRGTATDAAENANTAITFPNPVPSGYKGTIAIKGLPENADVRITDINGQLLYRTTALGGQAVWNGTDYKGRRPQSGVYLIFAASADGGQTYAGKMVFMQ